jgi:hypothetical protein
MILRQRGGLGVHWRKGGGAVPVSRESRRFGGQEMGRRDRYGKTHSSLALRAVRWCESLDADI